MLDELAVRLGRAKDAYASAIKQIDKALKGIVAADPSRVSACNALQSEYAIKPEFEPVAPMEVGGEVTVKALMQEAEDEREGKTKHVKKSKAH
jgi:hypothetical protein